MALLVDIKIWREIVDQIVSGDKNWKEIVNGIDWEKWKVWELNKECENCWSNVYYQWVSDMKILTLFYNQTNNGK